MSYIFANAAYLNQHGNAIRFHALLGELIELGSFEHYSIVIPTGRRKRVLERSLIRNVFNKHKKPVPALPLFTLERLVHSLFEALPFAQDFHIISDAYRMVLFEEAMRSLDLPFFKGMSSTMTLQTIERCAELLYGLRRDGIHSDQLLEELSLAEADPLNTTNHGILNQQRLQDLTRILQAYESILSKEYLLDYPALLDVVCKNVQLDSSILQKFGTILFDGFSEFTEPEWKLLDCLERSGYPFACFLEYDPQNGPLFGNLSDTFSKLGGTGFSPTKIDVPQEQLNPLYEHLRKHLFSDKKVPQPPIDDVPFTILECSNQINEVESIARYIKWIHHSHTIPLSDIVVTMRNPEEYSPLFKELFPMHGLPVNITDRPQLKTSPIVTSLFTVLDIIVYGYRADDIRRLLSSPYLLLPTPTDSSTLREYLSDFISVSRIKGGKGIEEWINKITHSIDSLESRVEYLQSINDSMVMRTIQKQRDSYTVLLDFFKILSKQLPSLSKNTTVQSVVQTIHTLIDTFRMYDALEDYAQSTKNKTIADIHFSPSELLERDVRALKTFIEVIDEYSTLHTLRNSQESQTVQSIYDALLSAVSGAQYQIREKPGTGITVTSMEQIRELDYSIIIVCGLNEGAAPLKYTADTFMGRELADSEERHIRRERMQFYLSLVHHAPSQTKRQYLLTYPTMNADKTDLVRSHFVDELIKVLYIDAETTLLKSNAIESVIPEFLQLRTALHERAASLLDENIKHSESEILERDQLLYAIDYWKTEKQLERRDSPFTGDNSVIASRTTPFSITELDEYAECPFLYFSKRFLYISDDQDTNSWLSSLENGIFFHDVLYRFYTSDIFPQSDFGEKPKPIQLYETQIESYRTELFTIAHELFQSIRYDHPYISIEEEIIFGNPIKGIKGKLDLWLEMEIAYHKETEHYPALFEVSFGNKNDSIESIAISDGITIKGKIDRIEISNEDNSFVIGDYKTGKKLPTQSLINKGSSQQMPMYALAAQNILERYYHMNNPVPSHAHYYSLFEFKKQRVLDESLTRNHSLPLLQLRDLTVQHVNNIKSGAFPLKKKKDSYCTYCSFSSVCRVNAIPPVRESVSSEQEDIE